jgi:hypothetical protein
MKTIQLVIFAFAGTFFLTASIRQFLFGDSSAFALLGLLAFFCACLFEDAWVS